MTEIPTKPRSQDGHFGPDALTHPPRLLSFPVRTTHSLTLLIAGLFLVFELRGLWFDHDDWNFLAYRHVGLGTNGLFYPYFGHWTTIPILAWRLMFSVVGVRDYWLYALPMILAHLAVVHFLWRLMLHNRVEPWTAALLAASFAVIGIGYYETAYAFQLTVVGSVMFGLLAIESIQSDRPILPAVWGICALMCSDSGVPMVVACGLVGLARGKPRLAAHATVLPAAVFAAWYLAIGHATASTASLSTTTLVQIGSFVWTGLTAALSGYVDASRYIGGLLVAVIAAAAVKYRNTPAAMAAGALFLFVFIGIGRIQFGVQYAASGRYGYVAVALLLPIIGQIISVPMRRIELRPFVTAGLVLLVGVNAVVLHKLDIGLSNVIVDSGSQKQMEAAAYLIHEGVVLPGQYLINSPCLSVYCEKVIAPKVNTLRAWIKGDKFPVPSHVPPGDLRAEEAVLGVSVSSTRRYGLNLAIEHAGPRNCSKAGVRSPVTIRLVDSASLRITRPHRVGTVMRISFVPRLGQQGASVSIPIAPGDRWLSVHSSAYSTAMISTAKPVLLCPGSIN